MEVILPDPALGEAPRREDVSPMEDMLPPREADDRSLSLFLLGRST